MKIIVNPHDVKIKTSEKVNENEYNITKCEFEFSEEYTDDLVKVALFTNSAGTYKQYIVNNECNIPAEILEKNESTILGVYSYKEENEELVLRYSPEPIKFFISKGSYIENAENSEPLTPTDKEQIEQAIVNLDNDKQDKLISGENIKTINGASLLGEGDIEIDQDFVKDDNYVHTDNNYTTDEKDKLSELENYDDSEIREDISELENDKVDKIKGKGLSTNDYTTDEKNKLAGLSNYDDTEVKSSISDLQTNKADRTEIPDVSNFITRSVDNLLNYYLKSETYTKEQVNQLVSTITSVRFELVNELPSTGESNVIYLVPSSNPETQNVKDEYIWINNAWEQIGSTSIDLSDYVTITQLNTALNNYTTTTDLTTLLNTKQNTIDSLHKLSSDLVDDTNKTNKFVTTQEKTTWNNKVDTSDLTDYVKNTDYGTANKAGVLKQSNWLNIGATGFPYAFTGTYAQYENANGGYFIGKGTLENVIAGKELVNETKLATELSTKEDEMINTATGSNISLNNTKERPIKEIKICGKSTQNGTPSIDNPIPIVDITSEEIEVTDGTATQTANLDIVLRGIPVSSGGNYTDNNGQQWVCDTIERYADGTGKLIQRIMLATIDGSDNNYKAVSSTNDGLTDGYRRLSINNKGYPAIANPSSTYPQMSNMFEANSNWNGSFDHFYSGKGTSMYIFIKDTYVGTTYQTANAWLANNPVQMEYILATPIETPLTAEQLAQLDLSTYKPTTNINSNADVVVEYVADTKNYIDIELDKKLEATDYASTEKAGVAKVGNAGISINSNTGLLYIAAATPSIISGKSNNYLPIVPRDLDYAVKTGITTNTITLTATEKDNIRKWLGLERSWKKIRSITIDNNNEGQTVNGVFYESNGGNGVRHFKFTTDDDGNSLEGKGIISIATRLTPTMAININQGFIKMNGHTIRYFINIKNTTAKQYFFDSLDVGKQKDVITSTTGQYMMDIINSTDTEIKSYIFFGHENTSVLGQGSVFEIWAYGYWD